MKNGYLAAVALALTAAALLPPMHDLAHDSFAWHMVQHLVLIFGVAPLLVFAIKRIPLQAFLTAPIVVVVLHTIAIWAWHLPVLYDRALEVPPLHALEHVSFVGTAMLFWGLVTARWRRIDQLRRAAVVFVTGLQSAALGALLVFASEPLYSAHVTTASSHGLTPLEDQQLAGGIMWIPPGVIYLALTLGLFLSWMRSGSTIATGEGTR